ATALRMLTVDTVPPASPPTGLLGEVLPGDGALAPRAARSRAMSAAPAMVRLTWSITGEPGVVGYRVKRDGQNLATVDADVGAYLDGAGSRGEPHWYAVAAVDGAGNMSAAATVEVRVDLVPPLADILKPVAGAFVSGVTQIRGTATSPDDFKEYRLLAGL